MMKLYQLYDVSRSAKKVEGPARPNVCPSLTMTYTALTVENMPSDAAKFASAVISLCLSLLMLLSIFLLHDMNTNIRTIRDKDESESDDDTEEVEPSDIPMAENQNSVLQRMCEYGCCPRTQHFTAYYEAFDTDALHERKDYISTQREYIAQEYTKAKDMFTLAKENFALVTQAYKHLIESSEKLNEVCETREIRENLQGHSVEEMYAMLAAVHHWKPFVYAPTGLYPYQKELWENALLKEIYQNTGPT
jgi:hypothetical protein